MCTCADAIRPVWRRRPLALKDWFTDTLLRKKKKRKEIKVSPWISETFDESRQIGKERVQTVTAGLI